MALPAIARSVFLASLAIPYTEEPEEIIAAAVKTTFELVEGDMRTIGGFGKASYSWAVLAAD